jgi:hypothetical protein
MSYKVARANRLKEQLLGVLTLINGYLRHLRSRIGAVHEIDDVDAELVHAVDGFDL